MPRVEGHNLLRQKMAFPQDFTDEFNLVFIPFQQWQQRDVDSWVPLAEWLEREIPYFNYYEFPTLPRNNPIYRFMLNEGMRAGIPDSATRARTVTLYLDKQQFRTDLDIASEDEISVMLFDGFGQLLWRTTGPYTLEKATELNRVLEYQNQNLIAYV
ncbi:MAG: hypothetical protein AAF614_21990 [Chloroflexota bacterium]